MALYNDTGAEGILLSRASHVHFVHGYALLRSPGFLKREDIHVLKYPFDSHYLVKSTKAPFWGLLCSYGS